MRQLEHSLTGGDGPVLSTELFSGGGIFSLPVESLRVASRSGGYVDLQTGLDGHDLAK